MIRDWLNYDVCVEAVEYSVIVNKDTVGPIISGLRLKQCDLLSLYLFIICAKGLLALIRDKEA